jgi:hypothetical protein
VSKHVSTLAAIFATPVRANIRWTDIEALFRHKGGEVTYADGSRVHVALNGRRASFHKPHPRPDTDKGAVKSVRKFLKLVGIEP